MKIINIHPTNSYSCFHCQGFFPSPVVLAVIWFCSKSCKFKYAYGIVNRTYPLARKELQFSLTKKMVEVSL